MKSCVSSTLLLTLALAAAPALAQQAAEAAPAADAAAAAEAAPAAEAAATAEVVPAAEAAPAVDEAPKVAAGVDPAITAMVGTPPAGKGLVVFYRPARFVGSALAVKVFEDGAEVGRMRNDTWFAVPVEPGTHAYSAAKNGRGGTRIEVEADETYFLFGNVSMGGVNLTMAEGPEFQDMMGKLKAAKQKKSK